MKKRIEKLFQKIRTWLSPLARTKGEGKPERQPADPQTRLSRQELLEVLVKQSRRIDELEAQLKEANEKLAQRELIVGSAGTLAEAALKLNHIFEDADAACRQYRESLVAMTNQAARQGREEETA